MAVVCSGGGAVVEVAAVRARERVHRLPLTVVIDCCGEDMGRSHERNASNA